MFVVVSIYLFKEPADYKLLITAGIAGVLWGIAVRRFLKFPRTNVK